MEAIMFEMKTEIVCRLNTPGGKMCALRKSRTWPTLAAGMTVLVMGACMMAAAQPADVLAGPKVSHTEVTKGGKVLTIVEKGFDQQVTPALPTPEEAALGLLTLSTVEQAKVSEILGTRAAILDGFVSRNTDLLTKLGVSFGTNDKTDQVNLLLEATAELRPLINEGPLQDALRECLHEDNAAKFDGFLKEYWQAFAATKVLIKKEDGKYPSKFEVVSGAKIESLGKEIERSFQRMLTTGVLAQRLLLAGITLDAQQSVKVTELFERHAREGGDAPTDAQNAQLVFTVLPLLREEQRTVFMGNIRELILQSKGMIKQATSRGMNGKEMVGGEGMGEKDGLPKPVQDQPMDDGGMK